MKKFKIFIVDDNKIFLDTLERHLISNLRENIEIHKFYSGDECLKRIHIKPEIVILDYNFDSEFTTSSNGVEILKKIMMYDNNIKVIMLSGQEKIDVAVDTIRYNAFDYVVKNKNAFHKIQINIEVIFKNYKLRNRVKKLEYGIIVLLFTIFLSLVSFLYLYFF